MIETLQSRVTTLSRPRVAAPVNRLVRHLKTFRAEWLLGVSLMLVALALNTHDAATRSLWYDEAFSVELARQPFHTVWWISWRIEHNMQLYYLTLYAWLHATHILGINPTEIIVRLPSIIAATISTVVLYLIGTRYLGGKTVGVIAALVYALNNQQLNAAQQTRGYAFQMLFICLAWYALFTALHASGRALRLWWLAYVLFATMAVYSQLMAGLVLIASGLFCLLMLMIPGPWRERAWRSVVYIILSHIAILLLLIPAFYAARYGTNNGWVPPITTPWALYYWLFLPYAGGNATFMTVVEILALVPILAGAVMLVRDLPRRQRRAELSESELLLAPRALAAFLWFIIPLGIAYFVTQPSFNLHLFDVRYLVVIIPAIGLLAGMGVSLLRGKIGDVAFVALAFVLAQAYLPGIAVPAAVIVAAALVLSGRRWWRQALVGAVVLWLAALALPGYYSTALVQDFRTPAQWIEARFQPGDAVACAPGNDCALVMDYYFAAYPGPAHFTWNSPGLLDWSTYTQTYFASPDYLRQFMANHHHLFYVYAPVVNDQGAYNSTLQTIHWLDTHYTYMGQIRTTVGSYPRTVWVRMYDAKTAP